MKKFNILLGITIIIFGIYRIIDRIWVTEDAYITFKHIENFYAGNGLTFNKIGKIESFTHPLWVVLLIIGKFISGLSVHSVSIILGILFSTISLLFIFIVTLRKTNFNLPIFILPSLYVMHQGFIDFSTSGLENSLTFLLISILFYKLWDNKIPDGYLVPSLLTMLYFIRPEFILVALYYSAIYAMQKFYSEGYIKKVLLFGLIPMITISLYHIFRYTYYQEIFPMSYHAKAGSGSDWASGLTYLKHTIRFSPLLNQILIVSGIFILYRLFVEKRFNKFIARDIFAILVAGIYIIRMGGDFMAFRLLLPSILILYIIIDKYINSRFQFLYRTSIILNITILLVTFYFGFGAKEVPYEKWKIGDERAIYYKDLNQDLKSRFTEIKYNWYLEGTKFKQLQSCLGYEPFIITNSVSEAKCSPGLGLGYFATAAGTNVSVIDELGFTDKNVVLREEKDRRPGHLKSISLDYVVESKSMFCSLNDRRYDELMQTKFGVIINLDPELLYSLGEEEYSTIVSRLKNLYSNLEKSNKKKDIQLLKRLKQIEQTRKIKILELEDEIPTSKIPQDDCWK